MACQQFRHTLPDIGFIASAGHAAESLAGVDALIPGMVKFTAERLQTADKLTLIQQAGAGLDAFWQAPFSIS